MPLKDPGLSLFPLVNTTTYTPDMNQDDFAITVLGPPDSPSTIPVSINHDGGYREHDYHSPYGSPSSPGYLNLHDLTDGYQGYSTPESPYGSLNLQGSEFSGPHGPPTHPTFVGTYGGSSPNSPVPSSPNGLSAVSQSFNGISLNDPPSPFQEEHVLSPAEGGYTDQSFYNDSERSLILGEGLRIRSLSRPASALSTRSALLPPRIAIPQTTSYSAPASRSSDHYSMEGADFVSSIVDMEALSALFDDGEHFNSGNLSSGGLSDVHIGVNDYNVRETAYPESYPHSPSASHPINIADLSPMSSGYAIDAHIGRESHQKEELFSPHHYPSTPGSTWNSPDSRTGALSSDTESASSPSYSPAQYSAETSSSSDTMYVQQPHFMEGAGQRRRGHSVGSADGHTGQPSVRGRTHTRMLSSPSNSRRPSPYPQSRSPVTPSSGSGDLLSVPQREFGVLGDSIRRRHSFTQASTASEFLSPDSPSGTPLDFSGGSLDSLHGGDQAAFSVKQSTVKKIASQAGIKASEARRTKEARFHCNFCPQSFTTNHNLKNHLNVHLGIKPFQCPGCHRASTTQSVHARHLKTCKAVPEQDAKFNMTTMP